MSTGDGDDDLAPGWYPDPFRRARLRWWDGAEWTDRTAEWRPREREKVARAPKSAAELDPRVVKPLIRGVAAAVVGSLVLAAVVAAIAPTAIWIAVFYGVLFAGMLATCRRISRTYGTGNLAADFGWQLRRSDVGAGMFVFACAMVASWIAYAPWAIITTGTEDVRPFTSGSLSAASLCVIAVSAIAGAPLVEELAFRGVLQRGLVPTLGPRRAIGTQAVLFGLYHFRPELGWSNVGYLLPLVAFGAVVGIAATRWGRLGPGMVAHALTNVIFVLSLAAAK